MGAKNAKNPNPHDCGILLPITDPKCAAVRKANEKKRELQKKKDDKERAKYDPRTGQLLDKKKTGLLLEPPQEF